jgi:hypothetical protein
MKPTRPRTVPDIIRVAIERVTGDPHQARREVVQAILDDLAAAGLTIVRVRQTSLSKSSRKMVP